MQEIKTYAPARGSRRGYWYLCLLSIVLITLTTWLLYRKASHLVSAPVQEQLQQHVAEAAADLAHWRADLQMRLVALAEQKNLRAGIGKLQLMKTSPRWRDGFLQAMDAACRSLVAAEPAVKECTLRDLEGNKLAGTGIPIESINYPDIMQRVHEERLAESDRRSFAERWTVPVRDAAAQPLAFLVARVRVFAPDEEWGLLLSENGKLQYGLYDSTGAVIARHGELFDQWSIDKPPDGVHGSGQPFHIARAPVPGSDWTLIATSPETENETGLQSLLIWTVTSVLLSVLIMILFSVRLVKR